MRQSWLVARFTFREAVRKRAFWITNIIYLIMLVGTMVVMPLVGDVSGDMNMNPADLTPGDTRNAVLFLLDESENPYLAQLGESFAGSGIEVRDITHAQLDAAKANLGDFANAGVVHITLQDDGRLLAEIHVSDMMSRFPATSIGTHINHVFRHAQFVEAGVDVDVVDTILAPLNSVTIETYWVQNFGNFIVAMVLMMMMFMTVHTYGTSVAMSVATEKSTRVMETLIVSCRPPRILVGKVIGMGSVGLAQMLGLFTIGGLLGALTAGGSFELGLGDIDLWLFPLLLLYFLMGFAVYALINAMLGAMVSKLEDLNAALAPAAIVTMISFYIGGLGPVLTGGGVGRAVMLVPFTAPFAAPSVLLSGDFDATLIALSASVMVVSILLLSWIAGKIYSASVLHYGSKLKFGDLGKLIKGNKK